MLSPDPPKARRSGGRFCVRARQAQPSLGRVVELIDRISPDELRQDVRWALDAWAAWFRSVDSISRRLAVAVLSHCRILHTLATGEVSSKRLPGESALHQLDPEWASLIRWALEDRPDPWTKVGEPADPVGVRRMRALVDHLAG